MKSFSSSTKHELLTAEEKIRRCCSFSLIYGILYSAEIKNGFFIIKKTNAENVDFIKKIILSAFKGKEDILNENGREIHINSGVLRFSTLVEYKENIFKCGNCTVHFLKGVFLSNGTLNDPLKSYRLEFVFYEESKRNDFFKLLLDEGICGKTSNRGRTFIIYIKDSNMIEDFLVKIGATHATFEVMNSKILKEIRNNANRATNCDAANINKSLQASKKHIDAITELVNNNKIDLLPESLKETALKRLEFKELNYAQLGEKFDPPISKSGIYHRLEKIFNFYKSIEK